LHPQPSHTGEAAAFYADRAELLTEYPELEEQDIRQALRSAAAALDSKDLPSSTAP